MSHRALVSHPADRVHLSFTSIMDASFEREINSLAVSTAETICRCATSWTRGVTASVDFTVALLPPAFKNSWLNELTEMRRGENIFQVLKDPQKGIDIEVRTEVT